MKTAVIVFPGSNRDRDMFHALELITGTRPVSVWHTESALPDADLVIVPGGFSYGDYLRSGAIAARSPILKDLVAKAESGVSVLGVCNGFQILCEAGLLPGALIKNVSLKHIARDVELKVDPTSALGASLDEGRVYRVPVSHGDGNFRIDEDGLAKLKDQGQIVFRYVDNPNGSVDDIAGITDPDGRVLGMMPHPERATDPQTGGTDGALILKAVLERSLSFV